MELVITPRSDRFDPYDDRWRQQVGDFDAALAREVGGVRRKLIPVPGTKGGIELIVIALGSAGAFTAAVEFFTVWLRRDRTRSLEITHTVDGRQETIRISGESISNEVLGKLAVAAAGRLDTRDEDESAAV